MAILVVYAAEPESRANVIGPSVGWGLVWGAWEQKVVGEVCEEIQLTEFSKEVGHGLDGMVELESGLICVVVLGLLSRERVCVIYRRIRRKEALDRLDMCYRVRECSPHHA
jgi:hypothetical protein